MERLRVATDICPVCLDGGAALHASDGSDTATFTCRRCGEFTLTGTVRATITKEDRGDRRLLSSWIYEQCHSGVRPILSTEIVRRVLRLSPPSVQERADKLLEGLSRQGERLGESFDSSEPGLIAATWSIDASEVDFLLLMLGRHEYVEGLDLVGRGQVTPAGYIRLDDLRQRQNDSARAFVAMWFSPEIRGAYDDGLAVGVRMAGYHPVRVDGVEHIGKIDDEIIAQIRRARFVVADFTGHRSGVYFEAGFGLGLGLPVVWTCRKDQIDGLHFDIRQFNCIDWEDPADLAHRLQARIEAAIGRGPLESSDRKPL